MKETYVKPTMVARKSNVKNYIILASGDETGGGGTGGEGTGGEGTEGISWGTDNGINW